MSGEYLPVYYPHPAIRDVIANGEEALRKIKKNKPDLIILDVLMPKMDGFELLKYLKSDNDYVGIPVIMLTVKSGPRHLEQGISFGADFYLPKPFKFDNLMQFIDLILGRTDGT